MAKAANTSLLSLLLAIGFAGVLITGGVSAYEVLSGKEHQQTAVTETVIRWKRSFRALAGTEAQWEQAYTKASNVRDQLAFTAILNLHTYGLKANTDALVFRTRTPVVSKGVDLALTKLCLGTGGDSFVVEANNYDALLSGLSMLANRKDIYVDNISILGDKDVPQAKLGNLCLYLRSE